MKWSTSSVLASVGSVAVGLLSGCGALAADRDAGTTVVTGFYPLEYVATRVAGDHAAVESLTQPGGEPHDSTLGVRETALVARADVVVLAGGVQPAVDEAVTDTDSEARVVDPMASGFATGDASRIRPDDPHFWQDPLLMADLGDEVAAALADVDPAHAEAYADNAARLRVDLQRLDQEFAEGLADCERSTVVVSHDAFGYLDRYGLTFESIAGLSPAAEPTPADLARLQQLVRREAITTVFTERLSSPAMAQTLASDLGVTTATLDPVEGLTDETSEEDYASLMRANLAALREANGC